VTSDKPERATSTQPPYRLQVLGGFRLSSADGEIVVPGAKERALLAYLAVTHPKVHRREALRELLWASRFEAQGRQSLRQALYRLRKLLGSEVIVTNDAEVSLDGQLIASDIGEFEARAATEQASEVEAACRLYLGDLLAGFATQEEAFESWLAEERRRVREQAVAAMLAAAEAALAADRTQPALDFARQALAQDDLSEAAHRILIRCFAAAGRRTEALRQYETLKAHLQDQLGVSPEAVTRELVAKIRGPDSTPDGDGAMTVGPVRPPLPHGPSIAVMTFTAISGTQTEDTIAEGLAEDIVTALSKVSKILVVARASTRQYKDQDVSPQQVSRDQGVRHVLSGAVQIGGDQVRVTAQLIDASSGHQIWADRYDRSRGDFLGLQDEITREVVSALQVQLTDGEQARVWARGTRDLKAWENIVRATEKYHSHHRDEIPKARDLALEATRIDPEFAAAWAVLGWTYWVEARWDWSERRDESLGTAYELAHRSLRMDSHLPDGLTLLAVTELHLGRHDEALATFERACLSAPNHSYVAALCAYAHSYAGDWRIAIAQITRAVRLSPSHPVWYLNTLGRGHWINGDVETSVAFFQESARRDPDVAIPYANLATIFGETGRLAEAEPVAKKLLALEPQFSARAWCANNPFRDDARRKFEVRSLLRAGLPA
jgi:TolB-like protein/DNA-binding SARP family transcriptional activator